MHERLATLIATAVRQARVRAGLPQAQVAQALGLTPLLYARLERGKLLPGLATLRRLSATLETPADVLLGQRPPDAPTVEAGEPAELRELCHQLQALDTETLRALDALLAALLRRRVASA